MMMMTPGPMTGSMLSRAVSRRGQVLVTYFGEVPLLGTGHEVIEMSVMNGVVMPPFPVGCRQEVFSACFYLQQSIINNLTSRYVDRSVVFIV